MQLTVFANNQVPDLSTFLTENVLSTDGVERFHALIYDYYAQHGRSFVWRNTTNPYHIMVSEVMLQQTQTERVKEKFEQFVRAFPSFEGLANARFSDVMFQWQGLGYNRRALALHKTAQTIVADFGGVLPADPAILVTFGGIGKATAASICAFAFNMPTIFIETNIRTVFIQIFFPRATEVHDDDILPLVEATLDRNNPRTWYYALMDYGVALKKICDNPSRKSAHHIIQSRFEGSERQIRGMILKLLTEHKRLSWNELTMHIPREEARIKKNLESLCNEGFVKSEHGFFALT